MFAASDTMMRRKISILFFIAVFMTGTNRAGNTFALSPDTVKEKLVFYDDRKLVASSDGVEFLYKKTHQAFLYTKSDSNGIFMLAVDIPADRDTMRVCPGDTALYKACYSSRESSYCLLLESGCLTGHRDSTGDWRLSGELLFSKKKETIKITFPMSHGEHDDHDTSEMAVETQLYKGYEIKVYTPMHDCFECPECREEAGRIAHEHEGEHEHDHDLHCNHHCPYTHVCPGCNVEHNCRDGHDCAQNTVCPFCHEGHEMRAVLLEVDGRLMHISYAPFRKLYRVHQLYEPAYEPFELGRIYLRNVKNLPKD